MNTSTNTFGECRSWEALLDLRFAVSHHKTVLKNYAFKGPLQVQKLFYHDSDKGDKVETCHCYILHPPGGLVSGDSLTFNIELEEHARALLTSTSANKFYKGDSCNVKSSLTQKFILNNCQLEFLPLENIFFNGAVSQVQTVFDMDKTSSLLTWDINCFGRAACDETFTQGYVSNKLQIIRAGIPLIHENLVLDTNSYYNAVPFLNNFNVQASLYAITTQELTSNLKSQVDIFAQELYARHKALKEQDCIYSLSMKDDLVICRYLGQSSYKAFELFKEIFVWLRPLIFNKKSVIPRIWNT